MWHYETSQSQHRNNDNNDNEYNMMRASLWLELFGGLFWCRRPWYMGRKCDNKVRDSNWAHPLPRVLGYRRETNIMEGDIIEVRVHYNLTIFLDKSLV